MIHVATVHWRTDRWIDLQLRYLERFVRAPYRVYAYLNGVDERYDRRFHFVSRDAGSHGEKLNALAAQIAAEASADDLLVFLDGDAFPIAELVGPVRRMLERRPLAAVRRDENVGDRQPHPSFCATTVGFWGEIEGDWRPGHEWRDAEGRLVTDFGGNLLRALEVRNVDWHPILRTNGDELHPLWFGIYGDLIYHHGAGFRRPISRLDGAQVMRHRLQRWPVARRLEHEWIQIRIRRRLAANERLSERVFARIQRDDDFYRELEA
jgi:hypothetical protein